MASKKVLSIEIGYSLTKVLEIDYKSKNPKVYSSFVLETPNGFFTDDVIGDFPEFSKQVRERLDVMGIKTKNAVFTISSSKIASREVPIPASVKENRIQSLIEMNAGDYFPIDLSSYRLSYTVLRNEVKEGLENKKYLLVLAAPKNLLESYVRFGRTCGLETVALDYNGNSLYQAIKDELKTEDVKMFLKVDEKNSFCMVTKGQDVIFTRNLAYGIDDAVETIIDNKAFEDTNTYLKAMEYARAKTCIYSSYNHEDKTGEAASDSKAVYEAKCKVTDSLKLLTGGIARVIDFYKSKNPEDDIKIIYLTGIGADFSGLQKLIAADTGFECKVYTHFESIRFDKAKELPLCEYITCIGAAEKSVNFIATEDNEIKEEKANKSFTRISILVFIFCIVLSAGLVFLAYLPYQEEKQKKEGYERSIAAYSQAMDVYAEYINEKASYEKLQYYVAETDNNMNHIIEFIEEMEAKMPRSLRVQSMAASNDGVNMSVTVDSKESVAALISSFESFKSVKSVSVTSISITTNEVGEEICAFAVVITFSPLTDAEAVNE